MAPRYDKVNPLGGSFRARLNADLTVDAEGSTGVKVVSLNSSGRVVIGTGGQSGFVGVMVKNVPFSPVVGSIAGAAQIAVPIGGRAGDVVDIMTHGEIVDVAGLAAGTRYFAKSDGTLSTTSSDGPYVGHTVEATRLIVNSVGAPIGSAT